jgi:hypothetical protein
VPKTTCTLSAGLYVVTGAWTMKNNSYLTGTGVTLYVTCAQANKMPRACGGSGEAGGSIDFKNGDTQITAPSSPSQIGGYAIVYDRLNTSNLDLQGNGNTVITGSVYAVRAMLSMNGNSCFSVDHGVVVIDRAQANGNPGCLNVTNSPGVSVYTKPGAINLDQ